MKQENPMQKYAMAGSRQRDPEGVFQQRGGNGARDERRAIRREQRPATFAELQEDGIARPAPPSVSQVPQQLNSVGPGATASSVSPATLSPTILPIGGGVSMPSGDNQGSALRRKAALDNLRASFAGQRKSLDEDLARRGLWASTGELGAGARLGDLAGQQARAEAALESDLYGLDQQDEMRQYELLLRLAQIFGLGG